MRSTMEVDRFPRELVMMSEDFRFAFKRMRMKHIPEVIDIMRESLYFTEPLMRTVDLKTNIMGAKQVDYLMQEIAAAGVSVVAIEVETRKVVGAGISFLEKRGPIEKTFLKKQRSLPNIFPAYGALLEANLKMEEKTFIFDKVNVDWLMILQYFATHPDYYRQGIGKGTLTACVKLAKAFSKHNRGVVPLREDVYRQVRSPPVGAIASIFTTPLSQRIARSLNWEEIHSVNFSEWLHRGKTMSSILKEKDENLTAVCMTKKFTISKRTLES